MTMGIENHYITNAAALAAIIRAHPTNPQSTEKESAKNRNGDGFSSKSR